MFSTKPLSPALSLVPRTMAGPFTPNFGLAMETQQAMDRLTIVMTIIGGARALWPLGKVAVQFAIRFFARDKGVDPEEDLPLYLGSGLQV